MTGIVEMSTAPNQPKVKYFLASEAEMMALASEFAKSCQQVKASCKIYLQGELGTGKTTFARGFLRALGYQDKIKSPTYTLMETYALLDRNIYHLDLYRISDANELEFIGLRDILAEDAILLVEWPERAKDLLPPADLYCYIEISKNGRTIEVRAQGKIGETLLKKILRAYQKDHGQ
jgi:tRNA threonylcarbamoyladenosine biosynthesis protein TsaE